MQTSYNVSISGRRETECDMYPRNIAYHVVTDRPMYAGQILTFDENTTTGVCRRVMDRRGEAERIYAHPEQFCAEELEHHTRVALRELAMEQIRR